MTGPSSAAGRYSRRPVGLQASSSSHPVLQINEEQSLSLRHLPRATRLRCPSIRGCSTLTHSSAYTAGVDLLKEAQIGINRAADTMIDEENAINLSGMS